MRFETPSFERLPALLDAMDDGYSPNTSDETQAEVATRRAEIRMDELAFVDKMIGVRDETHMLRVPPGRLPSLSWWGFEGDRFIGSVQLRWQEGTLSLPLHVLGHIGYAVRPDEWGRGLGSLFARHACEHAKSMGMEHVEIACLATNVASQRIIEKLGGVRVRTLSGKRKVGFVYKVSLENLRF